MRTNVFRFEPVFQSVFVACDNGAPSFEKSGSFIPFKMEFLASKAQISDMLEKNIINFFSCVVATIESSLTLTRITCLW